MRDGTQGARDTPLRPLLPNDDISHKTWTFRFCCLRDQTFAANKKSRALRCAACARHAACNQQRGGGWGYGLPDDKNARNVCLT